MSERPDRRVHAVTSFAELVRYDRAGKWYVEDHILGRSAVPLEMAVRIARHWARNGGQILFGAPGGRRFDARVRALALSEAARKAARERGEA